jgi:hypothetical protein
VLVLFKLLKRLLQSRLATIIGLGGLISATALIKKGLELYNNSSAGDNIVNNGSNNVNNGTHINFVLEGFSSSGENLFLLACLIFTILSLYFF